MKNFLISLWKEEDAAAAVEYALMIALIAVVIMGAVQFLGSLLPPG